MNKQCNNNCSNDADWYCKNCDAAYCFDCVEKKSLKIYKNESHVHVCSKCKRILKWVGMDNLIEPETEGLKTSFMFPFSQSVLPVFAVLFIISLLFSKYMLLNEILYCLLTFILQAYSLNVLHKTVSGGDTPPKLTSQNLLKNVNYNFVLRIFKYSLSYLAISSLFYWAFITCDPIFSILFFIPALFLPYVIMRSTTARSLNDYLNDELFVQIIKKNRFYYPVTIIFFFIIFSIFPLLTNFSSVLVIPVIFYAMTVSHRILGKMVIKSHSELNYSINYDSFKRFYSAKALHGSEG